LKVLILGSGAREHAIADAFSRSEKTDEIFVSPGNDGIAASFKCVVLPKYEQIYDFCNKEGIDLVFIGPEQAIADGTADRLREAGLRVLAPSQKAAMLETSKAYAKRIMEQHNIPTARYALINELHQAEQVLSRFSMPVVLKADGLAAGKGVIIAEDMSKALDACAVLLQQQCGSTGVLAEEFLQGWEVSLFAFCDGKNFKSTIFAQDHKQVFDNDKGPNTGGMGAYAPVSKAEAYRKTIESGILKPIMKAMEEEMAPYSGILYLGLMITNKGPKVIEYNCRLGDPETQAVLPLLKTDFMDICMAICDEKVDSLELMWEKKTSLAVVLAAPGYPGSYEKDIPISIPRLDSKLYFAGIKKAGDSWRSNGGRVLSVVASARDIDEARAIVYREIERIDFPGKVYRKDIGKRKNEVFLTERS
jgi:phosphoribosylamine--glycine ligase